MSLPAGTKLGPYEIVAPIGAGGMGEVYRARDTRLGRDVAVKVLPEHLSANPEIRARFEREAKTVSSLNHPNICTLFDVGREGETDYLVMELIEGQTLSDRLQRGALPGAELLRIGMQVADALDRAHRANVIHRDLKPGNIMLTRSGAKLMDFGLARATGLASAGAPGSGSMATLTHSPTIAKALTAEGTLLGTFQYMSPEQLEGADADARSDIWALGCVLYEMATGRRAFEGRSQASLIAAILERDPMAIPEAPSGTASGVGAVPQGLDRLIRNCLTKDPEERIQTAHDVKLQLRGIAESAGYSTPTGAFNPATPLPGSAAATAAAKGRRAASPLPWAVAAIALAVAIGTFVTLYPRATAPLPLYRFRPDLNVPGSTNVYWPRLSPDGRYLAFATSDSAGVTHAWVRKMDETAARPIIGADNMNRFYWSPDSKEIAFITNDRIVRIPIAGGAPVVVCPARLGSDLAWGSKGQILMDGTRGDSLKVVPAAGGDLQPATRIDRKAGELGHGWPTFLPDGEHFLYIAYTDQSNMGRIRLGKLGSLEAKTLGQTDGRVEYAPGGWMLYMRGTSLVAQKLDVGAGKVSGQPITIAEQVRTGNSLGHFTVSSTGVLAYSQLAEDFANSLVLADRRGNPTSASIATGNLRNPQISPDGQRLLVESREAFGVPSGDIGVADLSRETQTRLTFTNGRATTPQWSPDGRRFAYTTFGPQGPTAIHIGASDGLGAQDSIVLPTLQTAFLAQWAANGSRLVLHGQAGSGPPHMVAVPADDPAHPIQDLFPDNLVGAWASISPDGRWIAFSTGRQNSVQLYVQSLSGPPGRWQISTAGGFGAKWTKGGRELIYEGLDSRIWAVDIDTKTSFHPGTPHVLFTLPSRVAGLGALGWSCDANGEKFVLVVPPRISTAGSVEVVTNFDSLVRRK